MKTRNTLIVAVMLLFTSCTQRACQRVSRDLQFNERNYIIRTYSGGKLVREDKFRGIINQEEKSDGMYYMKGDTLIEVSGTHVVMSTN